MPFKQPLMKAGGKKKKKKNTTHTVLLSKTKAGHWGYLGIKLIKHFKVKAHISDKEWEVRSSSQEVCRSLIFMNRV